MKKLLLLLGLITFNSHAQQYGNEWIDYSQNYYSFKIWKNGIYRLDANTLNAAGIPLASINSSQLQLFAKQKEIPIYVNDGGDGILDNSDYIEFYGIKNDGWLDSLIYKNPLKIGNPGYSLYNDTLRYFFTWKTSGTGNRFIEETDVNYTAYTPSNYVLAQTIYAPSDEYKEGYREAGSSSSFFVDGEGWATSDVAKGTSSTTALSTNGFYNGADAPNIQLIANVISNSATDNLIPNHHVQLKLAGNIVLDQTYTDYPQTQVNQSFPSSWITSNTTNFIMSVIDDVGATTDYQALSYVSLIYPRTLNFSAVPFVSCFLEDATSQSKIRLDITGLTGTTHTAYVLNPIPRKIPIIEGATNYVLIPNGGTGENQQFIIEDQSQVQSISSIIPVNGTGKFTNYLTTNFENAVLMIYHEAFFAAAQDYKNYRESIAGGSHNVILANVDELYNQFGGGIEKHIFGIRRFSHFAYNHSTQKPEALFLTARGIDGISLRQDPSSFQLSFIPSFGYPPSDVSITSNLEGTNLEPLIPTGRIAARDNQQLSDYLDKAKQNVLQQDPNSVYNSATKDWQKHVLHFGGGTGASQQLTIQQSLNQMKSSAEHQYFGGHVDSYFKTTPDPFDPATLETIRQRLQDGVSLMTFFGHATSDGFEINIDDPNNWFNSGKYPMVIGNACYTGDVFHPGTTLSTSEKFVEVPNEGAIAFLSTNTEGFISYLSYYSKEFYRQFSTINYGKPIGELIKQTIINTETISNDQILETTCTQMALNGDPLIRLNPHNRPEIELLESNVSFTPTTLDLTVQNITMQVIVTNLGQSVLDTITLDVVRHFPGQTADSIYHRLIPRLDYKDTLYFTMPLLPNVSLGLNEFDISVDIPSVVPEQYDEFGNNQITKTLFVNIEGILPVEPYDFAVVPKDSVTVKACTINPLGPFKTYRFELDTTDLYNSPERRYAVISAPGGVEEIAPTEWISGSSGFTMPLVCTDSTVYFWRVAIDSSTLNWHEHSFQYIPTKEGWGQKHFFQFKNNNFINVDYDRPNRKRSFDTITTKHISCDIYDHANTYTQYSDTWWFIDQNLMDYAICGLTNSIHVAVVDPATFQPWGTRHFNTTTSTFDNPTHNFGNVNDNGGCRDRVENYFIFQQTDPTQMAAFENMITNDIPDSFYVLIYTPFYGQFDTWQPSTFNMFSSVLYSDSIYAGRTDQGFIFFGKKGTSTHNVEIIAQFDHEPLHLEAPMPGSNYAGIEVSPIIGPSAKWGTIYWEQHPSEPNPGDSTRIKISALDISQSTQFSIDTLFTRNDSIINLNNLIDATQYPYLQLSAEYQDKSYFTPAQMDRWHVLYDQLPEAAIDGTAGVYILPNQDTLIAGQQGAFAVDIKNIGEVDMDSLLVNYWIEDANQVKHPIAYPRQDSLRVGQIFRDTVHFDTQGLNGINVFWVEVNPYINGSSVLTDQPEQFHFNNIAQFPLYINSDNKNPILDVTFDGEHILNGDIVSPKTQIVISLKDDNTFLLMNQDSDTSLFGIYLTDPNGIQKRVPFMNSAGQQILQWIPANGPYNKFKIIYQADFQTDGTYTLSVQGSDKSGNLSGDNEYRISFDVILESSITYLMNFPNPFSTSTRFVFTLTGDKIPDYMIIQIMTITGKVVREITLSELGPIRIGKNISEYAWDGKDEFGDFLANGVYLYRVLTDLDNDAIKHRSSDADKYFKKEFGKMYLLR